MSTHLSYPGATNITYRRSDELPREGYRRHMILKAEALAEKAQEVRDFFIAADNTEFDQDGDVGEVRLDKAPAPGLIETSTDNVSGHFRAGELTATGWREDRNLSSSLVLNRSTIFMSRDHYLNGNFLPNMESLQTNSDGTHTFGFAYRKH